MKSSVKYLVVVGIVLVFASALPLSSSARSAFPGDDARRRAMNTTDTTHKQGDEKSNVTGYGGETSGKEQFKKGTSGSDTQGGGGSSLRGHCYGGQGGGCRGGQGPIGDYGDEQGGYGGGQGDGCRGKHGGYGRGQGSGCGGGPGGCVGGRQGGGGGYRGGQGGSSGHKGSEGGPSYVEPKCGELGCCYYTHGFCARCCDPWWVPPGEKNHVVPGKS